MIRAQIAAKSEIGNKFQELVNAGQLVPADVVMNLSVKATHAKPPIHVQTA